MIELTEEQLERARFLAFKLDCNEAESHARVAFEVWHGGPVPDFVRFYLSSSPTYVMMCSRPDMGTLFTGEDTDVMVGAYVFGGHVALQGYAMLGEMRLRECVTDSSNLASMETLKTYLTQRSQSTKK